MGVLRPGVAKPEGVLDSLRLQKGHVEVASQRRAQIASRIAVHLGIPRLTEVKTINGDSDQTCTSILTTTTPMNGPKCFQPKEEHLCEQCACLASAKEPNRKPNH